MNNDDSLVHVLLPVELIQYAELEAYNFIVSGA